MNKFLPLKVALLAILASACRFIVPYTWHYCIFQDCAIPQFDFLNSLLQLALFFIVTLETFQFLPVTQVDNHQIITSVTLAGNLFTSLPALCQAWKASLVANFSS